MYIFGVVLNLRTMTVPPSDDGLLVWGEGSARCSGVIFRRFGGTY
jgi:hypothetical protein